MLSLTTGVFVPQDTDALFHFHFNRCKLLDQVCVYNDINQYQQSHYSHKIACLQMPYPVDPNFDSLLAELVNISDHVLVIMSELHDRTIDIVRRNDHKKISYFICGTFNFDLTNSPVHKFFDWFTTSVHFYRYVRPSTLDILNPYRPKPKMFDALLGRKKLHRDIAWHQLDKQNNLVTYLGDITCNFDDPAKWIWESDGLEIDKPVEWTVDRLPYYGHRMSISQVVPLQIYNQTAYTLVAETNYSNHYSFYTEKTVKPILARRLFVLLGGQNQLANLRSLGFWTFDSVIDESYDAVEDVMQRCTQALDQVKYLSTQPQEEILDKIKPICEHNFNVMLGTNWYDDHFMPAFVGYFQQTQN